MQDSAQREKSQLTHLLAPETRTQFTMLSVTSLLAQLHPHSLKKKARSPFGQTCDYRVKGGTRRPLSYSLDVDFPGWLV